MGMLGKVVMAIGAVILILGIIIAIIPVNERHEFSASEFSVVGNDFIAPSVSIPAGVVVTVSWETDSWQLFGTPSCALAMKDSSGDYDVLASDEGKSGSFTYTTIVGGDYYILQRGMTVFTSGTVSISFTYFPGLVMGVILLIVGMIIVIAGSVLHKRSNKVTVIQTQAPPMQPMPMQPQYPVQYAPPPPPGAPMPPPQYPAPGQAPMAQQPMPPGAYQPVQQPAAQPYQPPAQQPMAPAQPPQAPPYQPPPQQYTQPPAPSGQVPQQPVPPAPGQQPPG